MAETTSKTTTKKPAAKAAPAKTVAKVAAPVAKAPEKKAAVAKKPAAEKKPAASKKTTVAAEQHYCMVAEAAYYRAERNGFMSDPLRDWIEAEIEIAAMLGSKKK